MPSKAALKQTRLGPVPEDPAYIAAQEARATFEQMAQDVRADRELSDLAKAEEIAKLWEQANATISEAMQDLQRRRQRRIDALAALIPFGPNIPADTSPADAVVLQQAFRAALAQARQSTREQLAAMYADAKRFGDDTQLRAVLTAAPEAGRAELIRQWAADNNLTAELTELVDLRKTIAGSGRWAFKEHRTFDAIQKPQEAANLPLLRAQAEAADRARRPVVRPGWRG